MANGLPDVDDCGIKKGPPAQYLADDLTTAVAAILTALTNNGTAA